MAKPKSKAPETPPAAKRPPAMRPLTIRSFVKQAEQAVQQTKGNMALKLARGSVGTMENYNREVGRIEGMDQCIGLLKDMMEQLEEAQRQQDLPEM